MQINAKTYVYRSRWTQALLAIAFFGGCSALAVYQALQAPTGLVINGILHLGPTGARVFYWGLAGVGALFVLAGVWMVGNRLAHPQQVVLSADSVTLPFYRRFRPASATVPLAAIESLQTVSVNGQVFLYLYASGLRYTLLRDMFADNAAYDDFVAALQSATGLTLT